MLIYLFSDVRHIMEIFISFDRMGTNGYWYQLDIRLPEMLTFLK